MSTTHQFFIGDAVIPKHEPEHDVMTIYDFEKGRAMCNWVVGIQMFKANFHTNDLLPIQRTVRKA